MGRAGQMKWLWLTLLVIGLDQVSKTVIAGTLELHGSQAILPWFNLVHACNTGATFSFLSDAGGWQRWFFIGLTATISVAIFVWLIGLNRQQKILSAALALILGGAIGNLWDRIELGCVVDFIQVYISVIPLRLFNPWPAFNVADSAITVGAILLIIDTFILDGATVSRRGHP